MDADRVVAALERYVLGDGDRVQSSQPVPDGLHVRSQWSSLRVRPAEWSVVHARWVRVGYRVVEDTLIHGAPMLMHGLLFDRDGQVWHLNDLEVLRRLGRGLGDGVEPVAYAEVLAEFLSGRDPEGPVVTASAPGRTSRAGWLVDDVAAMVELFPWVDPGLFTPPVVRRSGDEVAVEFVSCHQLVATVPAAADVLAWTVTGGPGRDPSWLRKYLAMDVEMP
jgi:hypothetical protein